MQRAFAVLAVLVAFLGTLYLQLQGPRRVPSYDYTRLEHSSRVARSPAAIRRVNDVSHLEGSQLREAIKVRMVASARITTSESRMGLQFGHFVLMDTAGNKSLACRLFDRISITLIGDGESRDGGSTRPTMEVQSPCAVSEQDVNLMAPLWIPFQRILSEPVGDGSFTPEDSNLRLDFRNLGSAWPKLWRLTEIRLIPKEGASDPGIVINAQDLTRLMPSPVLLDFDAPN